MDHLGETPCPGSPPCRPSAIKAACSPGKKVLINRAGGGIGTFAVQIAKTFGAELTGMCSTTKVDVDDVCDAEPADLVEF